MFRRPGVGYIEEDFDDCGASRTAIEEYALRVRDVVAMQETSEMSDVLERFGGRLHFLDGGIPGRDEGTAYAHGPNDFDIIVPTFTSARRDRFTIAHELGHYFLHSRQGDTPIIAYRLPAEERDRTEWEANWFAAGLLMPAEEFKAAMAEGLDEEELAERFNVSRQAAQIRMKVLNGV